MPMGTRDIRETLMSSDPEYRRLVAEHSRFEAQLEQIRKQTYLNSEDLLHEVELKKMKLRVKDRMEQLIIRFLSEPTYH
jgi:uncharacterized protein YdcH (DUF465 family)